MFASSQLPGVANTRFPPLRTPITADKWAWIRFIYIHYYRFGPHISLYGLNLTSQSLVRVFVTLRLSDVLFFHKLPNIFFFDNFLQIA